MLGHSKLCLSKSRLYPRFMSSVHVPPRLFYGFYLPGIIAVRPNNSFKPSPLRGLGPTGTASGGPA